MDELVGRPLVDDREASPPEPPTTPSSSAPATAPAAAVRRRVDRSWLPLLLPAVALLIGEAFTIRGSLALAAIAHGVGILLLVAISVLSSVPVGRLALAVLPIPVLRLVSVGVPALLIAPHH